MTEAFLSYRGFNKPALTKGFTLIEMMAVMAVLSVLLLAVWPLADLNAERERERELKRALWEIRDAIDAYKRMADLGAIQGSASGFPASLPTLVTGVVDHRTGATIYFLRRLPRDPFADITLPAAQTWGLRSYQSSAHNPQPGIDVYDVFSKSDLTALDDTPVGQW